MKKLLAPALMALMAFAGNALAQNAGTSRSEAGAAGAPSSRAGASRTDQSASPSTPRTNRTSDSATGQAAQSTPGSQSSALDQHIATCLLLGNQEEIALAQFAQQHSQNQQVKQFAQMMIEQHQQAVQTIQQAAPQVASLNLELQGAQTEGAGSLSGSSSGATQSGSDTISSASGNQRSSASAQSGASQGGEHQMMAQFAREVKQECLQLTQEMLGQKQGAEFDKAYIGQQLVAHTAMLAELKTSQKHASQKLQPILQKGQEMTEHHLSQAKQIMQQLDQGGAGGQAQRPGAASTAPRR